MVAERSPISRAAGLPEESELRSVADAARMLGVSPSTVWRWVDAGKLPALRIGPKAIRIRSADIDNAVQGADGGQQRRRNMMDKIYTSIEEATRPMTPAERAQAKASLASAAAFARRMQLRNGGKLFSDSAEIIREAREERSRQL